MSGHCADVEPHMARHRRPLPRPVHPALAGGRLAAVCAAEGRAELGARWLGAAEARHDPAPLLTRDEAAGARGELQRMLPASRLAAECAEGAATGDEALADLAHLIDA
jgi:hypothetical protein